MLFPTLLLALSPVAETPAESDSLRNFDIEEAVVVASPKETKQLRRQPLSVSLFSSDDLSRRAVKSVTDLSAYSPGFFMPDYGSRITSACYIRGIGSRINTPAVGLYVDNVPYVDKSAYNFSFQGIDRVDVVRGPQGTLYGRNTMGGLIRIFTADPITHSGTDLSLGYTTRTSGRRAAVTTYLHPAERMGLSLNAYYEGENGFYRNQTTGRKQDGSESAGSRLRWSWRPSDVVKLDWTASYEYSDQDANPYFHLGTTRTDATTGATSFVENPTPAINQNRPSAYRRHLFNTGIGVEHQLPKMVLTSITAYQHLSDRLKMDQDFTARDIFSLQQEQAMHTVSEEIALKSKADRKRWQWTTGLFAMYQNLETDCPVTFYGDGIAMLNRQLAAVLPQQPAIGLRFTGETLPFVASLSTPSANVALFHQSTLKLVGGLSMTLGLRLDYDHRSLDLRSRTTSAIPYHFSMAMGPTMSFDTDLTANPILNGKLKNDSWQVLPKASLNYELPSALGNLYFSVAKGYRSGGYNIQAYSDLSQSLLQRRMMLGVKDYSIEQINSLPLPDEVKQNAIRGMESVINKYTPAEPDLTTLAYKPEYTWSYELGAHFNLFDRTLRLDLATYYMKTRDQQLARFAESGMGRVMVNAGRSRSCGLEASLLTNLMQNRLQMGFTYGLTDAVFTNYDLGMSDGREVDYTGNRVPFVPRHTFSLTGDFRQPFAKSRGVKAVSIGGDLRGAGEVMWNEANTFSQPFYAVLGMRFGVEMAREVSLTFRAHNLTGTRYATFSFDSMNQRYAQYNQPRHFSIDLKVHF